MDNLEQIINCLRQIQDPSAEAGAARLSAGSPAHGQIYVRIGADKFPLYAEIIPPANTAKSPGATTQFVELWESLGWNAPPPGDSYYFQTWRVESDEDRITVAQQLEQALVSGFGVGVNYPLMIELETD